MILKRTSVQNSTSLVPGTFVTTTEFMRITQEYSGNAFYVIPALDYAVACTVELCGKALHIRSTTRAKNLLTFDNKIGVKQCAHLPHGYVFHFNHGGVVVGATKKDHTPLSLRETVLIVLSAHLKIVPKLCPKTLGGFIAELVHQIQDCTAPWFDTQRIGFYTGDSMLKHTNSMALVGIVASVLPPESRLRIKGLWAHALEYTETVFWLELKQASEAVYAELGKGELGMDFIRKLGTCL